MTSNNFYSQRGFTLVEAVVVIVITGILAGMVAMFIRMPVQGYFDSVARADLTDVADTALRRMARDLRLALPNSIRVSGNYAELLLTSGGGRYLAEEDNPTAGNILDFTTAANVTFDVVGPVPTITSVTDSIVVYNLGPGISPADAYDCTGQCNRATVSSVAVNTVTLSSNPFAGQTVKMRSPSRRFQVVTTPVTYACVGSVLTRYAGYTITKDQPVDVTAAPLKAATNIAVLANGVTGCSFSYTNLPNVRSALLGLSLTLADSKGETVTLFHQVHVDNTP